MKLDKKDLLLYGVTDSHYLNGRKLCELVEEAILGGVTMIQIREKEMSHEEFKQEALEVQEVCQKYHAVSYTHLMSQLQSQMQSNNLQNRVHNVLYLDC